MSSGPTPRRLEDDHWKTLAAIVDLPDERRALVENILGQAEFLATLDNEATATPPRATRKRLRELRKKAEKFFDEFRNLDPNVFMALICHEGEDQPWDGVGPWAPPRMMTLLRMFNDDLGKCRSFIVGKLDAAIARVPSEPPGDKTSAGDYLTREIGALLERETSFRLTATERPHDPAKEFLAECLMLAGMKITAKSSARRLRRGKVPV